MIRSSFFNSIGGDRKYDASKFAEYFNSFIGNGVFPMPLDGLQVVSNDDMTVTVKEGKAWINGYIMINDDDYILPIDVADGVLKRIDRVVVRLDVVDREIRVEVKKGTFASSPVAPTLQRDADAYELALADINIVAGAVSIVAANITDLRDDADLCGKVDSLIAGDINALIADLEAHKDKSATQEALGHVRVDGTTILIGANGVVSMNTSTTRGHVEYSDSIPSGNSITKTIPIGAGKTKGRMVIRNRNAEHHGVLVLFTNASNQEIIVGFKSTAGDGVGDAWTKRWLGAVIKERFGMRALDDTALSGMQINEIKIDGTNIKIVIQNTHASSARTLNTVIDWEVW